MDKPHNPDSPDHVRPSSGHVQPAANGPARAGGAPSAGPPALSAPDVTAPAPPLTLGGWLTSNGPYLIIGLFLAGWLYRTFGFDGILRAAMVVLGLGFVIFIHELGHFVAAKWCDVHVQTFSIGFGPALPGCSFTRGETTYKVAAIPLGGFVNMVGEGPEADEEEEYPRSFKNKTVGQRMFIISAGVIMNVLFGCITFVFVYRFRGIERPAAVVSQVEAGSRAWEQGVRSGWALTSLGNMQRPYFDDMKVAVALGSTTSPQTFGFRGRDGQDYVKEIVPNRGENDMMPVIGVVPSRRLKLPPSPRAADREMPVYYSSAAGYARSFDLQPGDVVEKASDPTRDGEETAVPPGEQGWVEVCRRLRHLGGKPMTLKVRRAGKVETVEAGKGFDWGDTVLSTTDAQADPKLGPFQVKELPLALTLDGKPVKDHEGNAMHDPFEYRLRMKLLAGKPAVVRVRRKGTANDGELVSVLVPPAFHVDFGMRMKMGEIAGVRLGSPAEEAGVAKGSTIVGVALRYAKEEAFDLTKKEMGPVRLPDALARRIYGDKKRTDPGKWSVILTVMGAPKGDQTEKRKLPPIVWDATWRFDEESPYNPASPMAIPELGIAYRVTSTVEDVESGSPAANAGIQKGDVIHEVRSREDTKTRSAERKWGHWVKIKSIRDGDENVYDQWAHYFWAMQGHVDYPELEVKVFRDGALQEPIALEAVADEKWPLDRRGVVFVLDTHRQKASTLWEALTFGFDRTLGLTKQIYLNLSSLVLGRISTKSLGGPIEIAAQAFNFAGEDLAIFALFLGMISINLAVVNFLPIPLLDGGHMVFLIYEKLRGRPASENVRAVATYIGLAFILGLMLFVLYLDLRRRIPWLRLP